MPYTSAKGLSVPATGTLAGTWGSDSTTPTANSSNALNEGVITLLDQALGQTTTLSLSSSNVTLTQLQTQSGLIRCTGTLLANIAISPDSGVLMTGIYSWENVTSGNFSVTLTNSAGSVVLPQGRRGLLWIDTTTGPRITAIVGSSTADPVPATSAIVFYNSAAPSGYTIVSLNDYGLQVVTSGSGATSGSVAYSTLFARTATDATTLTTNQIPSHQHYGFNLDNGTTTPTSSNYPTYLATAGGIPASYQINASATVSTVGLTSATGGGASHTHPLDMRVQTAKVLIATRN